MAVSIRAVVFVGPSLPAPRPTIDGLEYRPPARRGDLWDEMRSPEPPSIIGLIDGRFSQDLAVTPREVREVAATGTALYGASSMGALRAVECPDAMIGVGEVFAAFWRGDLTDDDEVALTFDDQDRILTYPMIQIRSAIRLVAEQRPSARDPLEAVLADIKRTPFDERSQARLSFVAQRHQVEGEALKSLLAALKDPAADVKRRDATALLELIRARLLGAR